MSTTTTTKPTKGPSADELRAGRRILIRSANGTVQEDWNIRLFGERLQFMDGHRIVHDLGHIDELRQAGWTIDTHPAIKMTRELRFASEYSIRSYFRQQFNAVLTDSALSNVARVLGMIEGLKTARRLNAADWLAIEFHRAIDYVGCTAVYEMSLDGRTHNVPQRKMMLNGEDGYSFGFAIYRPVEPHDYANKCGEIRKDWIAQGDKDPSYAAIDVQARKDLRIQAKDTDSNLSLDYTCGWTTVHYRYAYNGGIICRLPLVRPEPDQDVFPDEKLTKLPLRNVAWSIHT